MILLQPIVVVKSIKSLTYNGFLAFVHRYAITAPKQLAMAVAARIVVGDPIAVADAKAVLGAIPPDRTLHEPRKRLGERAIELACVDLGGEETENVSAPAGPIAPVAIRMASTQPNIPVRCRKLWTNVSTATNVAPTSNQSGR